MRFRGVFALTALGAILVVAPCTGSVLVQVTSPFVGGFLNQSSQGIDAVSFTLPDTYGNVDISVYWYSAGPGSATAYLTSTIGPGTTSADEVATTTVSYAKSAYDGGWLDVFSGLQLSPGTYYLMFGVPSPGSSNLLWGASNLATETPTITTGPGITAQYCLFSNSGMAYRPSDSFTSRDFQAMHFLVEGEQVPEPASVLLLVSACLAGLAILHLRRRPTRRPEPVRPS